MRTRQACVRGPERVCIRGISQERLRAEVLHHCSIWEFGELRREYCCARPKSAAPTFVAVNNKQHARGEDLSVKINVLPGMAVDPSIESKIASIDGVRYQQEKQFFESVHCSFGLLPTLTILGAVVSAGSSRHACVNNVFRVRSGGAVTSPSECY